MTKNKWTRAKFEAKQREAIQAQYSTTTVRDYAIIGWPEMIALARDAVKEGHPEMAAHYVKRLIAELESNRVAIGGICQRLLLRDVPPIGAYGSEHERVLEQVDRLHCDVLMAIGEMGPRWSEKELSLDRLLTPESTLFCDVLLERGAKILGRDVDYREAKTRLRWEQAQLKKTKPDLTETETFLMLELLAADGRLLKIDDLMRSNLVDPTDTYDVGSEATVKACVKRLIDLGHVERPPGKNGGAGRQGVRLTPTGKAVAERLKKHPPTIS
jgi:hypothetical protein